MALSTGDTRPGPRDDRHVRSPGPLSWTRGRPSGPAPPGLAGRPPVPSRALSSRLEVTMTAPSRASVEDALRSQQIELPSWAFGNSGTRFKVFAQPGVPRDPYEKIADAAQVHRFTGVAPSVALHIPWDKVDDYAHLAAHARELGV